MSENKLKIWKKKYPWRSNLYLARGRCNSPENNKYPAYGGRGIKCLITPDEIKSIWERDSAITMRCPTLDRINPDGNYTLENCRFIERSQNSALARKRKVNPTCPKGHAEFLKNKKWGRKCAVCRRESQKIRYLSFTPENMKRRAKSWREWYARKNESGVKS